MRSSNQAKYNAFTLLEILISIGLILIIAGISIPISNSALSAYRYRSSLENLVHSLRNANLNSRSLSQGSDWSVNVTQNEIILFKGRDFNARDSQFDLKYPVYGDISFSGDTDITFQYGDGRVEDEQTVYISNGVKQNTIIINKLGNVTLE